MREIKIINSIYKHEFEIESNKSIEEFWIPKFESFNVYQNSEGNQYYSMLLERYKADK